MKNKVEKEGAGETSSGLPKGVVDSLRAETLARLDTFKRDVAEASVETRGGVWRYRRTAGRGSLPTLLLPGIQGGGEVFYELALRIGDSVPLVVASAPDIEDVGAMVDSTLQFVDTLGFQRINLLGSSLGGYLVQAVALEQPCRVNQLIIANGFYDPAPFRKSLPPVSVLASTPAAELVGKGLKSILETPDDDPGRVALKTVMQALVGPVQPVENYRSRTLLLASAGALQRPDVPDEHVMVIDDDRDPMMPAAMRNALRERYAQAEQYPIAGGGHLPAIQRPQEFACFVATRLRGERPA
jgi:pimeloyl-ACP methyl ester carboxylesterase